MFINPKNYSVFTRRFFRGGFLMKKTYILEHLGCANCAAKIERRVASLPGIEEATLTFATRQLRITAENPDAYLPQIQKIANSLEPDIQITDSSLRRRAGGHCFSLSGKAQAFTRRSSARSWHLLPRAFS